MRSRYVAVTCAILLAILLGAGLTVRPANPCATNPPAKTVNGTVKAVSAGSLVVERGNQAWTFVFSEAIADIVQKLKVGESVTVRYIEADGKLTAVKVTAKSGKATKSVGQP